jgi:hypothetical protein
MIALWKELGGKDRRVLNTVVVVRYDGIHEGIGTMGTLEYRRLIIKIRGYK